MVVVHLQETFYIRFYYESFGSVADLAIDFYHIQKKKRYVLKNTVSIDKFQLVDTLDDSNTISHEGTYFLPEYKKKIKRKEVTIEFARTCWRHWKEKGFKEG